MQKGIIDRFRSLPMAPSAVLVGRTLVRRRQQRPRADRDVADRPARRLADPHVGRSRRSAASCCCCSSPTRSRWVMAVVGLLVPSPEVVNNAAFIVIFPLTFVANTFVPLEHAARRRCRRSPSGTRSRRSTQAARELFGNTGPQPPAPPTLGAAAPGGLHADLGRRSILVVFVPLADPPVPARPPAAEPRLTAGRDSGAPRDQAGPTSCVAGRAAQSSGRSSGCTASPRGSSTARLLPFGAV